MLTAKGRIETDLIKLAKEQLETRLLDLVEKANLKEEHKEAILDLRFRTLNYQQLEKKTREKKYLYHHLSGNIKTPDGWKIVLLKSVRHDDGTLKRLANIYNAIKELEKVENLLKEID